MLNAAMACLAGACKTKAEASFQEFNRASTKKLGKKRSVNNTPGKFVPDPAFI